MNDPYVAEAYLGPCQIYVIDICDGVFLQK